MVSFPETELILTPDHRVYHLQLKNEDIAHDVIIVGDPGRVEQIVAFFERIEFRMANREFITCTGYYREKRITVLSTGIGTDNIDIVMNELDAAVNIDPVTRTLNKTKRHLNIYRLGTCGGLQVKPGVDSLICSTHGLGLDGLLNFYKSSSAFCDEELSELFCKHASWPAHLPYPLAAAASPKLLKTFSDIPQGITATAPGFYGPQGRNIRLEGAITNLHEKLMTFSYGPLRILNFEMETSALYGLGRMLGHECITICVVIANRQTKEFSKDHHKSVNSLIAYALEKITGVYEQTTTD